ncbi:Flagellar basal-body rod protein FlgC [Candidatus Terasakiella magnetica]|uniref:Flagellar basal-body rod protein FlgC n=1 Tax=Candidatus Terasakiella magnetica TaxID=1867952 RepID=A0A1C3RKQ4_9PROT|nr:flagellar basal body rod protein FlgC [Candidatus Terasakiella magnetica]SCA57902.1 Flagellar basal-body rod protein FlgC [Candidatus Terasakiella magnetica]
MDDLFKSMRISTAGMKVQGARLRVISENVANADSLPTKPGENPYRRKKILFRNELDKNIDAHTVRVHKVKEDSTANFKKFFDPAHPAADENGYVLRPNVNSLIEMMDMREAQRSYEANVNTIKASKKMLQQSIGILR